MDGKPVPEYSPLENSIYALVSGDIEDPRSIQPCGAVLVSETTLITAAHCVERDRESLWLVKTRDFARDILRRRSMTHRVPYTRVRRVSRSEIYLHELVGASGPTRSLNDIAMIKGDQPWFSEGLPMKIQSLRWNPAQTDLRATIYGYGETQPLAADYGVLRGITKQIVGLRTVEGESKFEFALDQTDQRGICSGDSGGPAFFENANGELGLIGISTNVTKVNGKICFNDTFLLAIYPHKEWIRSIDPKIKFCESDSRGQVTGCD